MTSKIRYAVLGFVAVALLASVLVAASGASGKTVAVAATPELQRVGKQVEVRPAVQLETGWAAPGTEVAVAVTAGPSAVADLDGKAATRAGYAGTCTGEGESSCTVGYTGRRSGIDVVTAWVDSNGDGVPSTGEPF